MLFPCSNGHGGLRQRADEDQPAVHHERLGVQAGAAGAEQALPVLPPALEPIRISMAHWNRIVDALA